MLDRVLFSLRVILAFLGLFLYIKYEAILYLAIFVWISFPMVYYVVNSITVLFNNLIFSSTNYKRSLTDVLKVTNSQFVHCKGVSNTLLIYFIFIYVVQVYSSLMDNRVRVMLLIIEALILNILYLQNVILSNGRVFKIFKALVLVLPIVFTFCLIVYIFMFFKLHMCWYFCMSALLLIVEFVGFIVVLNTLRNTMGFVFLRVLLTLPIYIFISSLVKF